MTVYGALPCGTSDGNGFVMRKKRIRANGGARFYRAGQKKCPVIRIVDRSRPRMEAGPAFQTYARIFFAAAVTSGMTLKRSSTIP